MRNWRGMSQQIPLNIYTDQESLADNRSMLKAKIVYSSIVTQAIDVSQRLTFKTNLRQKETFN